MFSFREKAIYAVGFFAFIFVGPTVMYLISIAVPATFLAQSSTNVYLGSLSSAVGLFFAIWSNVALVKKGEGGAGNLGKVKMMKETTHLVTTGPYAVCRNPMHVGVFLYYMGFACSLNSLASLVVPVAILCFAWFAAVFLDEPRLEKEFPEEWTDYKSRVPRFFPRVWPRKA